MAIGAGGEWHIFVRHEHLAVFGTRLMAIGAGDLFVQAGQGIAGRAVIEFAGGLPGVQRVTAGTIFTKLASMFVGVAGGASGREAEESVIAVLDPYRGALGLHDMLCIMAALAREAGMLADQRIAGLAMVKLGF